MDEMNQSDFPIMPSEQIIGQMQIEERAFLCGMPSGLQHRQMLAVRDAMRGDYSALDQIRLSRNVVPTLPDGIKTIRPTDNLCIFSPTEPSGRKRPLLLYLHGGGWCFGSINSCARFCASLALLSDCCVAALAYRLSPQVAFPTPLNDCKEAFTYLKAHADEWGCNPSRISIGGDSAGGNLALATALSVSDVHKVIAIYPVTKLFTESTPSWEKYACGYGDDAELLEAFCEAYAGSEANNPLASVGLADDDALRTLPPVLIISAGHDILFDQTAEFAHRLRALHHPLSYHVYPTATHLFITVPGQQTAFTEAVKTVGSFLNSK